MKIVQKSIIKLLLFAAAISTRSVFVSGKGQDVASEHLQAVETYVIAAEKAD